MKKTVEILAFLFFVTALTDCARKPIHTRNLAARNSFSSKVLALKKIGTTDTSTINVSGRITGNHRTANLIRLDTLSYVPLVFINHDGFRTNGASTNHDGKFQINLVAGTYDIFVTYTDYNGLLIDNIKFQAGELMELNLLLESGDDNTSTKIHGQDLRTKH